MTRSRGTPILFAAAALLLLFGAAQAQAQAPSSGPPLPHMVAPDEAGVDLLNGRRVGTDSAISVGPPDAPTLEVSEGGGGLGGTPLGGFHYVDGSHPNYSDYFVLGSRGESNGYSDGTPRPLPDGMVWTGSAILERDGTRWNFTSTGVSDPYPTHYLTSLVRADGETLTYNYSSVPTGGDIRGRLRSITSSAGYQLNVEWTPESNSHRLTQVRLTNRRSAYCDPQSGSCTGSHAWPTLGWSTDAAFNVTVNTSGMRNVVYGARQKGPQIGGTPSSPIWEWTHQITSGAGVSRTYTERFGSSISWPIPPYYGRQTTPACLDGAVIWRVQDPAGTWSYNYTNSCQSGGLGTALRTDPLGTQAGRNGTTFTDELGRTTTYAYINQWGDTATLGDLRKVVSQTLPEGNQITWNYGSQYSPQNLLGVTLTPKPGSGAPTLSWQLAYPSGCTVATNVNCHRPSYEIDPAGNRTDYSYDPVHGGVLTKTLPPDAGGVRPQIRYAYQQLSARVLNASGVLVNETPIWRLVSTSQCRTQTSCAGTADETVTSYTYDDNLRPVTETVRAGDNSVSATTTRSYDPVGNVVSIDGPAPGTADTTRQVYDRLRRLVATMGPDPDGSGALPVPVTRTTYNGDNQPTLIESGTATDQSDSALSAMAVYRHVSISYDSSGRKQKEVSVAVAGAVTHAVTQYSYDARHRLECTAVRMNPAQFASLPASACAHGAAGSFGPDRITRNVYDHAGQLVQVQRAYGTPLQQNYAGYGYSPNGRRISVTDANYNRAEMRFDGHDRQVRWVFPSATAPGTVNEADYEAYGYDLAGNRISLRKRDGTTITASHDALGRATSRNVPASASGAAGYSVHYGYDLGGRQLHARFGSQSGSGITNTYDRLGRLSSSTTNMGGVTRTISHQYDPAGSRTRLTHPDGAFAAYEHDAAGRLTAVRENGGWVIAAFSYDPAGRRSGTTVSGAATAYGYDAGSRLSSLSHDIGGTAADHSLGFGYNPASQIVTRTGSNDAYASSTAYNVNRAYSVNGLNQYTAAGPATFLYDANGNLRSDGSTAFVYDAENRLVSASGAANATLSYDPLGRLWQVTGSSRTTRFLYDGDELILEYDGAGTLLRRFVHGTGSDDPLLWYEGAGGGDRRSLFADHQGSIVAVAGIHGAPIAINGYDSWGIPNSGNLGRFGYTGQAWIPELGMYHYKARVYSPTLGRFLQTDPVGYDDQINLYAYVGNDPVNHSDPTGTTCTRPDQPLACRIDFVLDAQSGAIRPPTAEENILFQGFNDRYTNAVGELRAHPDRSARVPDLLGNRGSFEITAGEAAESMTGRTVVYVGDTGNVRGLVSAGLFDSAGNPIGDPRLSSMGLTGSTTFVGRQGLNSMHEPGMVHDMGMHSTPQEMSGGLLDPTYPLWQLNEEHQKPYNRAACRLLRTSPCVP